jgi:hypothetical protein
MVEEAEALQSDVADIQQGTTSERVYLGAMAGSVDLIERLFTGIEVWDDVLRLNPELPQEMDRLDMCMSYRRHSLDLPLTRDAFTVRGAIARRRRFPQASTEKCTNSRAAPPLVPDEDEETTKYIAGLFWSPVKDWPRPHSMQKPTSRT